MTPKTYKGGCHCGDVQYSVQLELQDAISCNCSICRRAGWLLTFTSEDLFTLETPEDKLSDYQFGKESIHHHFCKQCGIRSFGRGQMPDGSKIVSINIRCLEGVDLSTLSITEYDGAAL